MSLIKTAQPVESIKGSIAGNVFTSDASGKHIRANPRRVHRCSVAQKKQRDAFRKARRYSTDNRTVSYLIYLALNDLPFIIDTKVTGVLSPNSAGEYILKGQYNDKDYYQRKDLEWFIWWDGLTLWYISTQIRRPRLNFWSREDINIAGEYIPGEEATGIATVTISVRPPPPDYNPPKW